MLSYHFSAVPFIHEFEPDDSLLDIPILINVLTTNADVVVRCPTGPYVARQRHPLVRLHKAPNQLRPFPLVPLYQVRPSSCPTRTLIVGMEHRSYLLLMWIVDEVKVQAFYCDEPSKCLSMPIVVV